MKPIIAMLLTSLTAYTAGLYFPWWSIAIAACVVALVVKQRPGLSFLSGFAGVFLLWLIMSWAIDASNDSVLGRKISALIGLGDSSFMLILLTGLIGGIVGGLGAMTGAQIMNSRPERE